MFVELAMILCLFLWVIVMSLTWICVYFDLVVLFDRLEVVGLEMRVEIFML